MDHAKDKTGQKPVANTQRKRAVEGTIDTAPVSTSAQPAKRDVPAPERKRQKTKQQDEDGSKTNTQELVSMADGRKCSISAILFKTIGKLKEVDQHQGEISLEALRDYLGTDPEFDAKLLAKLRENRRVETYEGGGSFQFRFRPLYGVRNKMTLQHLLQHIFPCPLDQLIKDSNIDKHETVERSKLIKETYPNVEKDLDDLIEQKEACQIKRSNDGALIVVKSTPHLQASKGVLTL